jgi:fluoride ion exporter CrcB/FEX
LKAKLLLFTFLGGALGSALRYAFMLSLPQAGWLWVVNILGATLLGFIQVNYRFEKPERQSLIGTGFAGGFTTLSSLVTFGLLGNDPNLISVAVQMAFGILFYAIGRQLGGSR